MFPDGSHNLILSGFMGTGKTAVGQEVARRLNWEFVDMDALIQAREGRSVTDLVVEQGEAHFRRLEADMCRELAARSRLVIAAGGGSLICGANREILSASGSLVCLTATPEEIARRLETAHDRPLIEGGDRLGRIAALLAERVEGYASIPIQVDTTGLTVAQVADRVLATAGAPPAKSIGVRYPGGEYQVHLGHGLLAQTGVLVRQRGATGRVALVTNPGISDLYAAVVVRSLQEARLAVTLCEVPDGEAHKTLNTVQTLYDRFIEAGLDRHSTVLALGGGIVGDMAGFAAATYLRGVPFVQLPTTLLAMVDSSVGGKVAVNQPQGKNLIGAFKQPALVVADPDTVATLPASEFTSGLAEVVKAGLIGDPLLVDQIETHGPAPLTWLIDRAIQVKVRVVEGDPFEIGWRAVLNLGHTFGHALESLSGYSLSHGQAVGIGLLAAARVSVRLELCDPAVPIHVEGVLARLGLPTRYQEFTPTQVWQAMATDKKRRGTRLRFVLLRAEGEAFLTDEVRQQDVLPVLEALRET